MKKIAIIFSLLIFSCGGEVTVDNSENQEIFTREIAIAGHHITSDIMKLKNLDYHSSEDLKISEGIDCFNSSDNQVEESSIQVSQRNILSELSDEIRKLTLGAFDITVGPLVDLWGFGSKSDLPFGQLPTPEEIRDAKSRMGAENLVIDQAKLEIIKKKDIQIDLSAVAKGYSVDEVALLLDSLSLESYFIEVGGEIKMKGLKLNDEEWITAIETPSNGSASIYQLLANRGKLFSIAGSGDYRNYFEVDGVRYSHEIDPRSGNPISHRLAAAFVISESAAEADALATAFMVLGLEESRLIIENGNIPAFLISRKSNNQFESFVSSPFSSYLIN